jgi:MerR family redox-sensitive transcriptional activator SoxR
MSDMTIGQLAKVCDLAPSAIRYYERAGLLPAPARVSRQRRYGADAIGRLRLLQLAREAGFSIAETRTFVSGFSANTPPAIRWRTLAERKLAEIVAQMARLERMRTLLQSSFQCQCLSIEDCVRFITARSSGTRGRPPARRRRAPAS